MRKNWEKILLFIKILLVQNVIFGIVALFSYGEISFKELITLPAFIRLIIALLTGGFGVGGVLFIITTLIYIKTKEIWKAVVLNLSIVLLYIFVFFEKLLDISDIYKELLLPLLMAIFAGVIVLFFYRKNSY